MFSLEENALKAALVRLGHQGSDLAIPDQIGGCLPMGVQMDIPGSSVRVWRTEDQIKIWDLTFAGKPGKHVLLLHFYNLKGLREPLKTWVNDWLLHVGRADDFHFIYKSAETLNQKLGGSFLEIRTIKAVRVAPLGFVPVKIENEHFKLKAGWDSFSIEFEDGQLVTPRGVRSVKKFHQWALKFSKDIMEFDRDEIVKALNAIGLKYHPQMRSDD